MVAHFNPLLSVALTSLTLGKPKGAGLLYKECSRNVGEEQWHADSEGTGCGWVSSTHWGYPGEAGAPEAEVVGRIVSRGLGGIRERSLRDTVMGGAGSCLRADGLQSSEGAGCGRKGTRWLAREPHTTFWGLAQESRELDRGAGHEL